MADQEEQSGPRIFVPQIANLVCERCEREVSKLFYMASGLLLCSRCMHRSERKQPLETKDS